LADCGYHPSPFLSAFETGLGVQTGQEILHKWDKRAARIYPRTEMTNEGCEQTTPVPPWVF
jgi:hypothetical protein